LYLDEWLLLTYPGGRSQAQLEPMAFEHTLSGLNPAILTWARVRAGLDVTQVASMLDRDQGEIEAWESGAATPTYVQLEKLAYKIYKRPVALFFFPEPPDEPDPEHSFRTLPDFELSALDTDTRFKIRDALAKREALYELTGGVNPVSNPIFREIRLQPASDPAASAARVRRSLGITLTEQRKFRRAEDALKAWRDSVESRGIFVFKESFENDAVSGFCLYDPDFPIIYINNSTAKTRQIFTLFHELAHILLQTNGVTKLDDSYIRALRGESRTIEIFCNRFAGELLVPAATLRPLLEKGPLEDSTWGELADMFTVSREVILRRALDFGLVSQAFYESKAAQWLDEYRSRQKGPGGNYYATQATYLGPSFLRIAFKRYYEGAINRTQLADFLNVRLSSLPGLESFLLSGTT